MRRRIYLIHSWLGLLLGAVLFVTCLSGAILVFRSEIDKRLDRGQLVVTAGERRLPFETLLLIVRRAHPGAAIAGFKLPPAADAPVLVSMNRGRGFFQASIDPYSGTLLGNWRSKKSLMGWIDQLHEELFAGDLGASAIGLIGLALAVFGATGIYIYRKPLRDFLRLRFRFGFRIALSDVHKRVGIAMLAFNLMIGLTGAYMDLWPVKRLLFHQTPLRGLTYPVPGISADAILERVRAIAPTVEATYVVYPAKASDPVVVYLPPPRSSLRAILNDDGGRAAFRTFFYGQLGTRMDLNSKTGAIQAVKSARELSFRQSLEGVLFTLHSGWYGGLPLKTLYAVFGLSPCALALSGFLMWRTRWVRRRRIARFQVARRKYAGAAA